MRYRLAILLALLATLPARAGDVLDSPEALVPADMPVFVKGVGLEALQGHLDAFCNKFPGPASRKVRSFAGPLLGRPFLVAADGTRPWGIAWGEGGEFGYEPVFLIPVEDAEAFQKALRAGMERAECRIVRGYALVSRDKEFLARFKEDLSESLKPSPLHEDLVVSFSPSAVKYEETLLAYLLSERFPERHDSILAGLYRADAWSAQVDRIHLGLTIGADGLHASARIRPVSGSRLSSLLASQKPGPVRWAGLAPAGSALFVETRLDPEGWAALMNFLTKQRDSATLALRTLREMGSGDSCLALFRGEQGWQAQGVLRPSDPERAQRFLDAEAVAWGNWLGHALGRGLSLSAEALPSREVEKLSLQPFVLTGAVEEGSGPPWSAFFPAGPRRIDAGVASSGGLLVGAAGPEAHTRLLSTAVPLGEGLEPRVATSWAPLLAALPADLNAACLVSLGGLLELAARGWPGVLPESASFPEAPVAFSFACRDGEGEATAVVPAKTLTELLEFRAKVAGQKGE